MKKVLKTLGNVLLIVALLGVGVVGMGGMISTRPKSETRIPEARVPFVATRSVSVDSVALSVKTQGTVSSPTDSLLVSEVPGRIVEVAPGFAVGGFFDEGDVLMRLDPRDMKLALARAEAAVAACEARLATVQAEAAVAASEWKSLEEGEPSPLALRKPQLAQARAELEAAHAALEHAQTDLERTVVRAPFEGCVREKIADMGQFVAAGSPLARLFAVRCAEVRLPLSDEQAAKIDLSGLLEGGSAGRGPSVVLSGCSAGTERSWKGRIVRVEGHVDAQSRMTTVVALVEDPYGRRNGHHGAPLTVGMFVEAEIEGRVLSGVSVVPRTAVREGGTVSVVDGGNRLRIKHVRVVQSTGDDALVEGLDGGDAVCITPLQVVIEGMRVKTGSVGAEVGAAAQGKEVQR